MAELRLDRVTDVQGLDALQPVWDDVWARSADRSPFLTWRWVRTWWAHFGRRDRLEVLVVSDGPEVLAIAPLLRARVGASPVAWAMIVGIGQETADYGGILLGDRPKETAPRFLEYLEQQLQRGFTAVNLTRLRPDGDLLPALQGRFAAGAGDGQLVREEIAVYPFLDLASLDDPAEHLRKLDVKNDVYRRTRRFAEQHELAFDYDAVPDEQNLAVLFELSARRWSTKETQMAGLFAGRAGRTFLSEVIPAMREHGEARLSVVRADGEGVAARLGFECTGTYLGYKECFDPEYKALGPGQYLTSSVLHSIHDRGMSRFDFLRGEGAHKSKWANGEREVAYWSLQTGGRRGSLARALMWKQLRLRLRRWTD